MIQRKQTIWLFLAALCAAGLLYFDVYRANVMNGTTVVVDHLKVASHYPSLMVAVLLIILPLAAIFMFKNRKRQKGLVLGNIFATFGFISVNQMRISNYNHQVPAPTDGTYFIGTILPLIILLFLVLALRGIQKDEKLVKSLDRLR
jgi:peptidoglycan/LPS O-acetylase OafA/YrhL